VYLAYNSCLMFAQTSAR